MPEMKTLTVDGTTFDIVDDSAVHCTYYTNLSTAITDLNNGVVTNAVVDTSTAKVSVGKADNGMTTVTLLGNVTESALIEVKKDINLVLNGYTLNFNVPAAYLNFTAGTNCTISGEVEGSAITKSCDSTSVVYMVQISSDNFRIVGGRYHCSGNLKMSAMVTHNSGVCEISDAVFELETGNKASGSLAYCVQAKSPQKLTISNCNVSSRGSVMSVGILLVQDDVNVDVYGCDISAVTLPDESVCKGKAHGIKLNYDTELRIENSTVFSDGPGDDAGETYAQGISNFGTIFCKNTNVTGTQCGLSSSGKLYESGGTFTGYSHGGFYLSDTETEGYDNEAYINDATIRCGNYIGEFTDIFAGDTVEILGGMYIGDGSNITAYMDGCSISEDNDVNWSLVVRASGGEHGNVLNISNSVIGGHCRVDNDNNELNLGAGVVLSKDGTAHPDATYASYVTFTNEVYRKHHPDEVLNGNDYTTLINIVDDSAVSFSKEQTLTADQKTQARDNIGAISTDDVPVSKATDDGAGVISFSSMSIGAADGVNGKSAYELWLDQGNSGTVVDFLNSLKGESGMTQVSPLYAESLEWLEANGETDKLYVLPSGFIYAYFEAESMQLYTNRLPSADTDTLFSGDVTTATKHTGYFEGVRLNSSGKLATQSGSYVTGFIPYTYQDANDKIRVKNTGWCSSANTQGVWCYDSNHAFLGLLTTFGIAANETFDDFVNFAENGIGSTLWTKESATNPTSTAIFKALICLKTRNGIIFSPHPRAKDCTIEAARIVLKAAVEAGAPEDIIGWITQPSMQLSQQLMESADLILATGGPGMVRSAYSSGRPALGVGPGNVPAVIDDSADILMAVSSIIHSKTFDNGMICASEQSVIILDKVYDAVKAEFAARGCYLLQGEELDKVRQIILVNGSVNSKIVGQSAHTIAALAGVEVPESTKILIGEVDSVDISEPFAHEKLSPVLAMYRSPSFEDALDKAQQLLEDGGFGHTAE